MKAFFWVWILPFVLLACHEARSAVLCNYYDSNGDAQFLVWRVGEAFPNHDQAATDELGAVCRVFDSELPYIQKAFTGLHSRKHPGYEVIYTGGDALFIINNL